MTRNHQQETSIELIIEEPWHGVRLDKVLASELPEVSRAQIQKWIEGGVITVDGEIATIRQKARAQSTVIIQLRDEQDTTEDVAQDIDIDVVYQDEHLAIINKEKGMVVHPGAGNPDRTLMNAILYHFPETNRIARAGIVHRLDKDTSGLMVVAKTEATRLALVSMLAHHRILREYEALVVGNPISGGTVNQPIGRDSRNRKRMAIHPNGKEAITHFRVLERLLGYSRVRCRLETGRTHQIRVHMKHLGFVLVGDTVYGYRPKIDKKMSEESRDIVRHYQGQALHSRRIQFTHPITSNNLDYKAAVPQDMRELLMALRIDDEWQDHDEWGDYEALWSEEGLWLK